MAGPSKTQTEHSLVKRGHTKSTYDVYKLQELKKCIKDPIYFLETYMKIQHPTKGAIAFEPFDFQRELIQLYADNRFGVALLPRQSGKCVIGNTMINIRNKKTGELHEITMEEFHKIQRK